MKREISFELLSSDETRQGKQGLTRVVEEPVSRDHDVVLPVYGMRDDARREVVDEGDLHRLEVRLICRSQRHVLGSPAIDLASSSLPDDPVEQDVS